MYRLYIANRNYSSWSLRPWLLMRELGIAFAETLVPFSDTGNAEAFAAFSPSGRVPCLHDGDLVVWDSLAITEYLAERHPGVWPKNPAARAFARCAAAEMHAGFAELRERCSMTVGQRIALHEQPPGLQQDLARLDSLWQAGLRDHGGPFLAGDTFSAADAFYAPVAFRIQTYGLPLSAPALAYAERLLDLPGMREWTAAALAEPWRERSHEETVARYGRITADLRTG